MEVLNIFSFRRGTTPLQLDDADRQALVDAYFPPGVQRLVLITTGQQGSPDLLVLAYNADTAQRLYTTPRTVDDLSALIRWVTAVADATWSPNQTLRAGGTTIEPPDPPPPGPGPIGIVATPMDRVDPLFGSLAFGLGATLNLAATALKSLS